MTNYTKEKDGAHSYTSDEWHCGINVHSNKETPCTPLRFDRAGQEISLKNVRKMAKE